MQYVFTLGLSTSTVLDVLITGILCFYLRRRRSGLAKSVSARRCEITPLNASFLHRMDRIISVLTLYTVENGMLTWYEHFTEAEQISSMTNSCFQCHHGDLLSVCAS